VSLWANIPPHHRDTPPAQRRPRLNLNSLS
jgi:hypothetical protein